MTKRDFEQAKARQHGKNAARDDSEVALQRLASGGRTEPGKLRKVICSGCGRVRYLAISAMETRRRARCTECGTAIDLI
jgi:hypothetical protein